mmetsp:Transcript_27210/g.63362  ORF Transcript_27210/g.63362 Transcript_27210/m.63362 type:complete len:519 (+) Transcript_27210:110-1666(+)
MVAPSLSIIVASTSNGGIGINGKLPWRLPKDMALFKALTETGDAGWFQEAFGNEKKATIPTPTSQRPNVVVMGRKTWDSIPEKFRPLKGRQNIVLTSAASLPEEDPARSCYPAGVILASSVADALAKVSDKQDSLGDVFVAGGEAAYREALSLPNCKRIFLTRVGKNFEVDTYFPAIDEEQFAVTAVSRTRSYNEIPFDFVLYERVGAEEGGSGLLRLLASSLSATGGSLLQHEEYQYLNLIREVIDTGVQMQDRTQVGTLSVFGRSMRFNLKESFPLLTTKRVFWKGVVEELLWFVKGDTNGNNLAAKGVKIWDANGSRDFLDKRGLPHREVGDLGPVYGFQWRHFGAEYADMHADYTGKGVDQLAECINKIKNDPTDRRILLSAWNPKDLSLMALPPCHMFCQFYVANGQLSCLMYQRSCDMGLGVPFNIASYSLLTCMMAQVCGLEPGEFVHNLGNTHVYSNHVDPLKQQLERSPRPFPILKMNQDVKDIDGFKAEDFQLIGYNPHPTIKMDMAV